jgi:hypothetical protein
MEEEKIKERGERVQWEKEMTEKKREDSEQR